MNKLNFIFIFIFIFINISAFAQKYTANWVSIGPTLHSLEKYKYVGRVLCITTSPDNIDEIYIGAATGGFWKTIDGGKNWRCTTDSLPGGISDIAIHPKNHNIIFATSSLYANSLLRNFHYGYGIYKSIDRGESWTVLKTDIKAEDKIFLSNINFCPDNNNIMYATALQQIYKSIDGGESWNLLNLFAKKDEKFRNFEFLTSDAKTIFVSGENCLYKSIDAGKTWNSIYDNVIDFKSKIYLTITENDIIYAVCKDTLKYHIYVKKSLDGGKNWTSKKQRLSVMKIETPNDTTLWLGGVNLYISNDSTKSFKRKSNNLHADIRDIFFPDKTNPNVAFVATDGGVNKTIDGGTTWKNINGNLCLNQCYTLAISEIDTNLILTGAHDNGTYKLDATQKWTHISGGDGGESLIDYSNPNNIFTTCNRSLRRQNMTTKRWSNTLIKMPHNYDARYIQHNKDSSNIYVTFFYKKTNKSVILKSENLGNTFQNPENCFATGYGIISAMAQGTNNTNIFYFASYDAWKNNYFTINKTADNGKTWQELDIGNSNINTRVSDIKINRRNSDSVWLAFNGFIDTLKVLESTDDGETWKNIGYNLPNLPVYSIQFYEPQNILLIGNDVGIYYLDREHNMWRKFGKNMPNVIVSDIKINYRTKKIFVSTFGRGIWYSKIKQPK